jgi:hypothetical protein
MAKDFKFKRQNFTGLQQLARSIFIDYGVVYIDQVHQQIKLTTTREKEQSSNSKSERQEDHMRSYSALRQHIRTNILVLCGP